MITEFCIIQLETSLGPIALRGTSRGILSVTFVDVPVDGGAEPSPFLEQCLHEMEEYFTGHRRAFSVPLVMRGTDFQQRVWDALLEIPFGQTVTYGQLAKEIGHPGAARAVGTAVGENPLAIIVPCHRVLPATGGIGEYASGVDRKEWLLQHEGVVV